MATNTALALLRTAGEIVELPRFAFERLCSRLGRKTLLSYCVPGDGQGVLIIPGFLANDSYNASLISFLNSLNYDAIGWGLGFNLGPRHDKNLSMAFTVNRLYRRTGGKITVVGHSLGGVYARELARQFPDKIRSVISLGSPISATAGQGKNIANRLFERLNPEAIAPSERAVHAAPPPVLTTAVYSRSDPIVYWRNAMQRNGHDFCENIAVFGSHCGMTGNLAVWYLLADRLTLKEGEWRQFD